MDIFVAGTETEKAECVRLRHSVFVEEQGVPQAEELDGLDDIALHILAKCDGEAAGAARVICRQEVAKIQRVCVSRSWRGRGLGAGIVTFAVEVISQNRNISVVRLGAQTHALDFYRKLGFREVGPVYLDADIPHRDMQIHLDR